MKRIKYAIMIFCLTLFVGLALYDEKPVAGLVQEMARELPEVVEPGNAWIVFLGFAAPEGVSPYAYGAQKMQALKTAVATRNDYADYLASAIEDDKSELRLRGELPSFYRGKDDGMLPYVATHRREIAALRHDNKELLQRYEALYKHTRYNEESVN